MKTLNTTTLVLFLLAALNACTPKMSFMNSTTVPAATGTINVKQDKNKNYVLNVSVQNLAESKQLTPAKNTYLVWMDSNENSAKKLGQIAPSGKALKAELKATTTAKPDRIYITAEDNADVQYPDAQVILTTKD